MPNESIRNPKEELRTHTKRVSIPSCSLKTEDLKRLYRLVNEKQMEVASKVLDALAIQVDETQEQFQDRCQGVKNVFIVSIQIKGVTDEVVTGHGEAFFDSPVVPGQINSIEFASSLLAIEQLHTPQRKSSRIARFFASTIPKLL